MRIDRARAIMDSTGVIDVEYNGQPVWIQEIDHQNRKVQVGLVNSSETKLVDVQELYETF